MIAISLVTSAIIIVLGIIGGVAQRTFKDRTAGVVVIWSFLVVGILLMSGVQTRNMGWLDGEHAGYTDGFEDGHEALPLDILPTGSSHTAVAVYAGVSSFFYLLQSERTGEVVFFKGTDILEGGHLYFVTDDRRLIEIGR